MLVGLLNFSKPRSCFKTGLPILAFFGFFIACLSLFPSLSLAEDAFDDSAIQDAICDLFRMSQGAFGALFALAAGIGSIVAAAFGMYRTAISFLVVSISYFAIPAFVDLSFNTDDINCSERGSFMVDEDSEDDLMIRAEICDRLVMIEGAAGALVATIAGIVAIISAAIGAYRAGYTLLFCGVGAFIIRALLSLYYGEFDCLEIRTAQEAALQEFFNLSEEDGETGEEGI